MKRTGLIFATLALSIAVNAQQAKLQSSILPMHNSALSSNEKVINSQTVEEPGKSLCDSIVTYEPNGEASEKKAYTYTAHGEIATLTNFSAKDGLWKAGTKEENTYDEKGIQKMSIIYEMSEGEFKPTRKYEYIYDEHGNLSKIIDYVANENGEFAYKNLYEQTFNESGQILTYSERHWKSDQWNNYIRLEYFYDEHGNNTLTDQYFTNYLGEERKSNIYVKTYDDKNNKTSETYKQIETDDSETDLNKHEYTYDEHGNCTSDVYYTIGYDLTLVLYTKQEYVYDDSNRMTTQITYANYGGWYEYAKIIYEYDNQGNTLRETDYLNGDNGWDLYGYDIYYYPPTAGIRNAQTAPFHSAPRKILRNGKLYIEKSNKIYSIGGQRM